MADLHASPAIFTFSALAAPQLSFPEPLDPLLSPPSSSLKRARPSDPETAFEAELPRKKRRLRLQLITSRLSAPFAMPASFVLPRVYALPWIRQRCNGRHVLRKAAILNKIRRDAMMATIASREQQERILEQRRRERERIMAATPITGNKAATKATKKIAADEKVEGESCKACHDTNKSTSTTGEGEKDKSSET
ncbi:Similar to hypothetical protein [Tuber melanosporum Mel28]; acc. no. XP_002839648 [Pyronema omphalodes CBS 100304]|uniref:Uncharacterized protein n=1 Tax=Pyronema omphalodes (strain CBS 100304) TaxID=1076935 RepID=U4LTM3_PYROM|nr:Similar to hypothetical protein [Tuber melanosporum Mel28]; acc. no. XP_002839648 [Pyronema omphalodes CBS 100304]